MSKAPTAISIANTFISSGRTDSAKTIAINAFSNMFVVSTNSLSSSFAAYSKVGGPSVVATLIPTILSDPTQTAVGIVSKIWAYLINYNNTINSSDTSTECYICAVNIANNEGADVAKAVFALVNPAVLTSIANYYANLYNDFIIKNGATPAQVTTATTAYKNAFISSIKNGNTSENIVKEALAAGNATLPSSVVSSVNAEIAANTPSWFDTKTGLTITLIVSAVVMLLFYIFILR